MCMQIEEKRPPPDVWVELGADRVKVDDIADAEKRLACRTTEHRIRTALRQFRCPIHHERIADVIILQNDGGQVAFDAYGCCPQSEAAARARLLTHAGQYLTARPLSLAIG